MKNKLKALVLLLVFASIVLCVSCDDTVKGENQAASYFSTIYDKVMKAKPELVEVPGTTTFKLKADSFKIDGTNIVLTSYEMDEENQVFSMEFTDNDVKHTLKAKLVPGLTPQEGFKLNITFDGKEYKNVKIKKPGA